ncbi:MAG: hypothetical protein HY682_05490 [Chloroflexi bacterium]|nr:hypothetical protein [Chloroflexota bacterium]
MATAPGPQDPDRWHAWLKARADEAWGESRAAAIETTLRRTSDALAKLDKAYFSADDRPGFFLTDFSSIEARGPDEGGVR